MVTDTLALAAAAAPMAGIVISRILYTQAPNFPQLFARRIGVLRQRFSTKIVVHGTVGDELLARIETNDLAFSREPEIPGNFGFDGVTRFVCAASRFTAWFDDYVVGGLWELIGRAMEFLSIPVRLTQSGLLQRYLLWIIAGLIGILGCCFYAAHHAAVLAGH